MKKDFERIWLEPSTNDYFDQPEWREWCSENQWGKAGVEYINAERVKEMVEEARRGKRLLKGNKP